MPERPGRWLRLLLRLQPSSVRKDYGDEWIETAAEREREARERGATALLAHRLREGTGALRAAIVGRLSWRGPRAHSSSASPGRSDPSASGLAGWMCDVRVGGRTLIRSPGFTLTVVVVLAFGIGATTTIFSGVRAVLLAPLPFDDADRLVAIWERNPDFGWEQEVAAPANLLDWRARVDGLADIAAYRSGSLGSAVWTDGDVPQRLATVQVTGNLFEVLGLRPFLGRWPSFEDTWADVEEWTVVSHTFWTQSLGADPEVVGRVLELDGRPVRVRAVLPEGVRFPSERADLWTSYRWARSAVGEAWFRRAHFVAPVGRLADGVALETAQAQLEAVALSLQSEHPELNTNMFAGLGPLRERLVGDLARPLTALMTGVAVLLLLACANVGTLFLVRAVSRTGELALRRAIGAGTGRIVRLLLVEALLVGTAGCALGLVISFGGIRLLQAVRPLGIAGVTTVAMDGAVLAFAVAVSGAAVLLFGLLPAVRATRGALPVRLAGAGGRSGVGLAHHGRLGQHLLPVQMGLAVVLVLAAALVTRSFGRLQAEDAGIDPAGVWVFDLAASAEQYPDRDAILGYWDRVIEQIAAVPGVARVAVTGGVPLTSSGWTSQLVERSWEPGTVAFEVRHRASSPDYFEAMGVPLLSGRGFTSTDGLTPPFVAIVNQAFADEFFPDEEVLGREVTFDREPTEESIWRTVVGVVGNERQVGLSQPSQPEVWEPLAQDWGLARVVVVDYSGPTDGLRSALQAAVSAVDPAVPLGALRPMTDVVDAAAADARFLSMLFGSFALLALGLAGVGIYGVTAQLVRRRVPEFGVRMALGAGGRAVVALVLGRVLLLAGAGVAIGAALAFVGVGVLETLLYRTPARDPFSFAVAPLLLLGVAILAAWVPARRAARADPMRSLRRE